MKVNYKLIKKFKNNTEVTLTSDYSSDLTWCAGSHHWKSGHGDCGNRIVSFVRNWQKNWSKSHAVYLNGQAVIR